MNVNTLIIDIKDVFILTFDDEQGAGDDAGYDTRCDTLVDAVVVQRQARDRHVTDVQHSNATRMRKYTVGLHECE